MKSPVSSHIERYPVLDGIRGYAILIVMMAHIHNRRAMLFTGAGEFGVWLFFVLSSFLLSLNFFQHPPRILLGAEWANYALRRFLRIYPAFTLAMLAGVALGSWSINAVVPSLLLIDPAYWAIFVEFKSYFLLPLIIVVFEYSGRLSFYLPCLLMLAALGVHYIAFPNGTTVPGYEPWDNLGILFWEYFIVFIIGAFAAWLYVHTPKVRKLLQRSQAADTVLLYIALSPIAASPLILNRVVTVSSIYYHLDWVPWSLVFAALIYGVMANDGYARRFFELKWMRFMGYISFSMYLFMDYFFEILDPQFSDSTLFTCACIACSTAFAWLMFVVVERPLSRVSWRGRYGESYSQEKEKLVPPAVAETTT